MRKGERKVACPKGHPYDGINSRIGPNGAPYCLTCASARRKTPEAKVHNVARYRRFRRECIVNKRCVFCANPAGEKTILCDSHAEQRRQKRVNENRVKREARAAARKARIDAGWCPDCTENIPARECVRHWTDFKEARWAKRRLELARTGKYKQTRNESRRQRLANDAGYWVESNLRRRVLKAIQAQGTTKSRTTAKLVGCSTKALIGHLEAQFLPGMTWDNRSSWHVDHRRPCASYDLTDPEQQRLCFHYTNLQPLWAPDNFRKGGIWNRINSE